MNVFNYWLEIFFFDKAANKIAFVCKKCYAEVLLKELRLSNKTSNTY